MKAVGVTRNLPVDDPACLVDLETETPAPTGRDVLVRVEAVSVNPLDTRMRAVPIAEGASPRILGWDAAGTVAAAGPDATLFRAGDRVYYAGSIRRPGTNSEYHLVDERLAGPMPGALDFDEAAALPLTAITAWEALFDRLGCALDDSARTRAILVIGGAGGVGSVAIQLAKAIAGLTVIATASREESRTWCIGLGADHVVDHTDDIAAQVRGLGFDAVDYVLCLNDTDRHFAVAADLVAPQGAICSIVANRAPLPVERLKDKSARFVWESMFTRSNFQTADMIEQHRLLTRVAEAVDAGRLQSTRGQSLGTITAANLRRAHALVEGGHTTGKVVLAGW
ncbi:MAG: zinc-binding alcohol dehydrogenase family protein [Betaproteobacteria bacterium]|nr:zinc-binding alcohol dehydrogenase family protein [Betaproteobacteria bacterium]